MGSSGINARVHGGEHNKQLQITMRCAIFLAIACVAMSAPTTEENIQAEEVNPLTSEVNPLTSEVSGQEIVEAYHPVNKKTQDSNALATNGRKLLGRSRRSKRRCTRRGTMMRWGGGRKRIGRHLYGQRMLYTWRYNRWWWVLMRRNAYNHHLHGRYQWRWTNHYKRIGVHRYRYQSLYRNYQGHWRRISGKWRLNRKNAYYRKPRWVGTRRFKVAGRNHYRLYRLLRWTGSHWVPTKAYWRRIRKSSRICARLYRGCHVRLYEHAKFRGRSRLVGPGKYNYNWIRRAFGNDKLSSVKVYRHRRRRRRVVAKASVQAPEQAFVQAPEQ